MGDVITMEQIRAALEERDGAVQKLIAKAMGDIAALQQKSESQSVNLIDLAQKVAGASERGNCSGGGGRDTLGSLASKSDLLERLKTGDARVVRTELACDVKAAILSNVGAVGGFPVPPEQVIAPSLVVPRFWTSLYSRPTSSNAIETVTSQPDGASGADATAEGALKPEASLSYGPSTVPICTVAFWALASRQLTEDSASFQMFLNGEMSNGLNRKIDDEVINGSGVAPHMNGIIRTATPWMPAAGAIGFDSLISSVVTLRASGASAVVIGVSVADYLATVLVKTSTGEYVVDPGVNLLAAVGAVIVPCAAVPAGNFVACGTPEGCYVALRNDITVEVSREDRDNFVRNMVTTLVEARLSVIVQRPSLCLYGPLVSTAPLAVASKS